MISRPGRPLSGARRTAKLQPPGDMAKFLAEKFFGKLPVGGGPPVISELRVQNYRLSANWPNFLTTFFEKIFCDFDRWLEIKRMTDFGGLAGDTLLYNRGRLVELVLLVELVGLDFLVELDSLLSSFSRIS